MIVYRIRDKQTGEYVGSYNDRTLWFRLSHIKSHLRSNSRYQKSMIDTSLDPNKLDKYEIVKFELVEQDTIETQDILDE